MSDEIKDAEMPEEASEEAEKTAENTDSASEETNVSEEAEKTAEDNGSASADTLYIENSEKPKKDKKKKTLIWIFSVLGAVILSAAVLFALVFTGIIPKPDFLPDFKNDEDFRFKENVYVNGISLNGLTADEATELLKSNTDKFTPSINLVLKANGKDVTLTTENFFYKYDIEEVVSTAKDECMAEYNKFGKKEKSEKHYSITAVFDKETVDTVDVIVCPVLDIPATNAKIISMNTEKLKFSGSADGSAVDREAMHEAIIKFFESGESSAEIELAVVPVKPDVTEENMSGEISLIASFSTVSTNNANGNKNMKTALAACNDSVILPGKIWSFNGCTGNSNLTSKGYVGATVIVGGKLETGIGGGICQASTTIYNALLYAGLEITERHNHYWTATYAKAGFDATIDYPRLDLKFRNNTDFPIYIKCSMSGKTLNVNIYGKKSAEFDEIKLSAKETSRVSGEYYTVESYRSFYKGGKLVRSEDLGQSKYSLKKSTSASTSTESTSPLSSEEPQSSVPSSSTPSSSVPSSSTPESGSTSSEVSKPEPPSETASVSEFVTGDN